MTNAVIVAFPESRYDKRVKESFRIGSDNRASTLRASYVAGKKRNRKLKHGVALRPVTTTEAIRELPVPRICIGAILVHSLL
jgi:hypothetical protein